MRLWKIEIKAVGNCKEIKVSHYIAKLAVFFLTLAHEFKNSRNCRVSSCPTRNFIGFHLFSRERSLQNSNAASEF